MSPSSSRKDRVQKLKIYQEAQVQHYWLVNRRRKLGCFYLQNGIYALVTAGMDEEEVVDTGIH
jgi:Uma2 family endonuclease